MNSEHLFQNRTKKLNDAMREKDISCMIICNSPNLYYMTGYSPKKCERFQVAFFPLDDDPVLAVPALYQVNSEKECNIKDQRVWSDGDDLYAYVKNILEDKHLIGKKLAIDDTFEYRQLAPIQAASPDSEFVLGSSVMTGLRMRKSPEELQFMKESGALSDKAVEMMINHILDGKSEGELKSWIEYELANQGMTYGFSNLIASGVNTSSPHHVSGSRIPQQGDAVYLDLGGSYKHYWSDITRSFHIGKPSDKYIDTYNRVKEAQQLAFESIKPGMKACDVHMVAWNYLDKYDLAQYFTHRLGHGVGMDGHELPNLSKDNELILQPGMTFSCEPGVYIKGEFGIRIEDTVAVTENGAMSFNKFTKDLIVV